MPPPGPGPGPGHGPGESQNNVFLVLFGVCTWDFLSSLWFEYRLITKRIRFRWQFVPYFLARYFVLADAIMYFLSVFVETPSVSTCARANFFASTFYLGLLTIVFSTWNLLTRVAIIWGHHTIVMRILFATGFVHFALALIIGSVRGPVCNPHLPSFLLITIFGTTTAVIELAILVFSLVGIKRATQNGESHLAQLLKTQGIVYFILVFCIQVLTIASNIAPTTEATRAWVPVAGTILSPILSCRLVTSTLSQGNYLDHNQNPRTHRIERFELSEERSRNPSVGRMTTCIEIDTTKDEGVC